jgi:hypothetical protein
LKAEFAKSSTTVKTDRRYALQDDANEKPDIEMDENDNAEKEIEDDEDNDEDNDDDNDDDNDEEEEEESTLVGEKRNLEVCDPSNSSPLNFV